MTRWAKCGVCGLDVRNKPILGTLHFCLTDEEALLLRPTACIDFYDSAVMSDMLSPSARSWA
jgi:hypothetical protein